MPEDIGVSPPGSLHLLASRAVHSPLEWHILEPFVGPDTQWVVAGTVHMCHSSVQTYSAGAARVKCGDGTSSLGCSTLWHVFRDILCGFMLSPQVFYKL